MFDDVLVLVFCFIMALASFGVAGWELAARRATTMDGMWLTLICLTLGSVFGGNVLWSIRKGELKRMLTTARKPAEEPKASEQQRSAAA